MILSAGGREPRWGKNGRELFFFAPDNRLMVAEVRTETGSFEMGAIHPLFQSRQMGVRFRYDVAKTASGSSSTRA